MLIPISITLHNCVIAWFLQVKKLVITMFDLQCEGSHDMNQIKFKAITFLILWSIGDPPVLGLCNVVCKRKLHVCYKRQLDYDNYMFHFLPCVQLLNSNNFFMAYSVVN